ncbi:TetR family transcriptional regulator [Actinomadura nitritigenes]|uniref:TetR/AcrR family transcriptional regulator n=1 Tax=Actinomadura nitritigenes TaxID=134602 RepID=UPI003D8DD333
MPDDPPRRTKAAQRSRTKAEPPRGTKAEQRGADAAKPPRRGETEPPPSAETEPRGRTEVESRRAEAVKQPPSAETKPPLSAETESRRRAEAVSRRRTAAEPRRADARRNRTRILEAALEAFAAEGRLVPLDDIARRAGVGAGTVYRNFPTKEALFTAVITERFESIIEEARSLADADDPGERFYGFLMWVVERAMFNHAICEALALEEGIKAFAAGVEEEFNAALGALLRRAQAAGDVRADIDLRDVRALMAGCVVTERMRRADGPPGRMTALACDALRPVAVTKLRDESSTMSRNESRCEVCGTPLAAARTGRPARFCGAACRQKAHRRRSAAAKSG